MTVCERYVGLRVFEAPVCLIYTGCGDNLILNKDVIEELRQIDQDLDIVGIAGPYRTGKSYLLNRLAGTNTGFSLGATIQAKTKGIWVWCRPHPIMTDRVLLLMDTEGLGDAEKGSSEHDIWILTLSVLLSSTLVFNILSVMNEDAMQEITLVAEIAKKLSSRAGGEMVTFPLLILTLRDFSLKLDIDGKEITADEYFEHCLKTKTQSSDSNKTSTDRQSIIECFPQRKCFTFDRPGNRRVLRELDHLPDSNLDPEFLEETAKFCDYVFNNSQVKHVAKSTPVSGPRFVSMVDTYLKAILNGELPNIVSAVEAMARIENTRACEEAVMFYLCLMDERMKLPTTQQELFLVHRQCLVEATEMFKGQSVLKDVDYHVIFSARLSTEFHALTRKNVKVSENRCEAVLKDLYQPIQEKMVSGKYFKIGGYQEHLDDRKSLTTNYKSSRGLGLQAVKVKVFEKFESDKLSEVAVLKLIDEDLRKQAEQAAELEKEIQKLQDETEKAKSLGRQAQAEKERCEQQLRERIAKEERRRQQSLKDLQSAFDSKMESALQTQCARLQSQSEAELASLKRQLR